LSIKWSAYHCTISDGFFGHDRKCPIKWQLANFQIQKLTLVIKANINGMQDSWNNAKDCKQNVDAINVKTRYLRKPSFGTHKNFFDDLSKPIWEILLG
jgi:hypothetical protein